MTDEIDTAAIRADADATYRELDLCDALDAARLDLHEAYAQNRAVAARAAGAESLAEVEARRAEVAEAAIAQVRALFDRYTDDNGDIAPEDGWRLTRDVRTALDGETS